MSEQLFKRAAVFTDIHFGKKNNERQHNVDCENFVSWFIETAKARGCDTIIFCGDWHDNRHSVHVSTLNYSSSNMERLSEAFEHFYLIPGNHDLYYKEKREITSVVVARNLNNITIINDFLHVGGVTFCPWLVGDEWKQIEKYAAKSEYMFGHFELPHFLVNQMVEMSDHGGLNSTHFNAVGQWAFSGHFHKRQARDKVCYLGNCFPHNFNDAWEDDRGMMVLDWGQEPEFLQWPGAPRYRTLKLSDVLENPTLYLDERTFAKITSDIKLAPDELQFIKETLQAQFTPRKLDLIPGAKQEEEQNFSDDVVFQSVDQIVIEGLTNLDGLTVDKNLLVEIYRGLS